MRQSNLMLHFLSMVKFVVRSFFDTKRSTSSNYVNFFLFSICLIMTVERWKRRSFYYKTFSSSIPLILLFDVKKEYFSKQHYNTVLSVRVFIDKFGPKEVLT